MEYICKKCGTMRTLDKDKYRILKEDKKKICKDCKEWVREPYGVRK